MSDFGMPSTGPQEGDRVERAEDVSAPLDPAATTGRDPGLAGQARSSSGLVADVTLAQGVTYTPGQLRVLRTSYVFRVNRIIRGNAPGEFVTINDTGGVYPDGSTVSTERSFRLRPGDRYVVFADRVDADLWLRQVLQVHEDGAVVADASGRLIRGIRDDAPVAEAEPTYEALRYARPVAKPAEPMEGPPDEASVPLPDRPDVVTDTTRRAAVTLDAVIDHLQGGDGGESSLGDVAPAPRRGGAPPDGSPPAGDLQAGAVGATALPGVPSERAARAVLSGSHVTGFQSHFHFMPDDQNWAWTSHCRSSWNALVENDLGLFAYKITTTDGQPIRDRLPVADDGQHNVGVLTDQQMTAGGYDTWGVLSANGVCYRWTDSNNRIRETDILINPAIAGNEAQFRKTLTHEFGHALTLDHETARPALMYPGTFRQPPNYASLWYSKRDDHNGVRSMLDWVNSKVAAGTWEIAHFADMATYSQAHDAPGTAGNLVMTRISSETVGRGDTATLHFVHVENRGNVAAQNVRLRFYLSPNETISAGDHEIGAFTWNTFTNWWSGSLNVRIPTSVPAGQYFLGWIVTSDTAERSSANNTAILMRDHTAGFTKVRVTVT